MKRAFTLFAVFGLVAAACGSGPDAAPPTSVAQTSTTFSDPRIPVIFDYSPTVSDVGALVFLAVHPDVRLVAVTLPGTGEGHCSPGVEHTRGVLVALGLDDVPVACAPDRGYGELNPFPEDWRASSDSMDLPLAAPNETYNHRPILMSIEARYKELRLRFIKSGSLFLSLHEICCLCEIPSSLGFIKKSDTFRRR